MVTLLSELWRLAAYLLRPEDTREGALPGLGGRAPALAGMAKAALWAALSVAAGLCLARLG